MYRQSPSRNQRPKGIKLKNVVQICLLLAVCFWLLYQVKHSHDKKKEFDEIDANASLKSSSSDEPLKLGRKDIRPRADEMDTKNESRDETSEEEETTEDDLEDKKIEEREDDEAGGRDDETEEQEQVKSDAETDRELDVDIEDREDGEENETREMDSEDGHGQTEKETTVDDTDHDASDRSAHEAREEHYKADDASSAVTHDTKAVTENENEHVESSHEHPGDILQEETNENSSEETYETESRKYLEVDGSEATANATTEGSTDHFISNTTRTTTDAILEKNDLPSENATESKHGIGHGEGNITEGTVDPEQANDSILNADSTHSDSNSTGSAETEEDRSLSEELSDSSDNSTDSSASENLRLEASNEEGDTAESSPENNNEFNGDKSDPSDDGSDESLETTSTDNAEEVQEDAIDISDTSDSMEEKDVRTDLETLPEIQTEGTNSDDVAAE